MNEKEQVDEKVGVEGIEGVNAIETNGWRKEDGMENVRENSEGEVEE